MMSCVNVFDNNPNRLVIGDHWTDSRNIWTLIACQSFSSLISLSLVLSSLIFIFFFYYLLIDFFPLVVWWSVSWWKKIRDVSDCLTDPRLRFHRCSLPSLWWVHDWCVRKEKERLTAAINRFTPLDSPLVSFFVFIHVSGVKIRFIKTSHQRGILINIERDVYRNVE